LYLSNSPCRIRRLFFLEGYPHRGYDCRTKYQVWISKQAADLKRDQHR
jgi:hypothetical protein